jgi:hypothetical protein
MGTPGPGPREITSPGALVLQRVLCGRCYHRLPSEYPAHWRIQVKLLRARADASGTVELKRCPRGECGAWNEIIIVSQAA